MSGPEGDAYFCDVCQDDMKRCDKQNCPGAPHPDDPHVQAAERKAMTHTQPSDVREKLAVECAAVLERNGWLPFVALDKFNRALVYELADAILAALPQLTGRTPGTIEVCEDCGYWNEGGKICTRNQCPLQSPHQEDKTQ